MKLFSKEKIKEKFSKTLFKNVYGRKNLKKSILIFVTISFGLVTIGSLYFKEKNPSSSAYKTKKGTVKQSYSEQSENEEKAASPNKNVEDEKYKEKKKPKKRKKKIIYTGKQIFSLEAKKSTQKGLVTGQKFLVKLMSNIDTRDQKTLVLAKTTFKVQSTSKGKSIPKGAIFSGGFKFNSKNKRVMIQFNTLRLPNGEKKKIDAIILSPKDYRIGIKGNFHSNIAERMSGPIALSAISTAADVMTSKKQIGSSEIVDIEPKLENAMLQAVAKTTQIEAQEKINEAKNQKPYVTINSGETLIVQLIKDLI